MTNTSGRIHRLMKIDTPTLAVFIAHGWHNKLICSNQRRAIK
jgi:hypothetical protein